MPLDPHKAVMDRKEHVGEVLKLVVQVLMVEAERSLD